MSGHPAAVTPAIVHVVVTVVHAILVTIIVLLVLAWHAARWLYAKVVVQP